MIKEQWETKRHSKMTAGYQGRNDGGSSWDGHGNKYLKRAYLVHISNVKHIEFR